MEREIEASDLRRHWWDKEEGVKGSAHVILTQLVSAKGTGESGAPPEYEATGSTVVRGLPVPISTELYHRSGVRVRRFRAKIVGERLATDGRRA